MTRIRIRNTVSSGIAIRRRQVSTVPPSTETLYNPSAAQIRSRCDDLEGTFNQSFGVNHEWIEGGLTYKTPPGATEWEFRNWVPSYLRNILNPYYGPLPGTLSNPDAAVRILSATNPSKPTVDLAVSLAELKDLPDLIRTTGRRFIDGYASGVLKYEFAIRPMVSDFYKLLDFKKSTDNRVNLLKQLKSGSTCRKATVFSGSAVRAYDGSATQQSIVMESLTAFWFYGYCHGARLSTTQWGYVNWSPIDLPSFSRLVGDDSNARRLARRLEFGNPDFMSTAWELLPWSWLADWFGNIGDWLQAHRSGIPVRPDTPSVCKTDRLSITYGSLSNPGYGIVKDQVTWTRHIIKKSRARASAALPSAHLPILNERQVSILLSIASLRTR